MDFSHATQQIAAQLEVVIADLELRLQFAISRERENGMHPARDQTLGGNPLLAVTFTGADTSLLTKDNGELLHSLEHIAAKILRLEPEEHDLLSFDAESFKARRIEEIQIAASAAVQHVRTTGCPFRFAPMNSRERRLLHIALANSGLLSASSSEGSRRFVVLHPPSEASSPARTSSPDLSAGLGFENRTRALRDTFRRR